MNMDFQNQIGAFELTTDNPLFQIVSGSPQNNLIFFT